MTDETKIEPALSAEEWAFWLRAAIATIAGNQVYRDRDGDGIEFENMDPAGFQVTAPHIPRLVALANAALPDSDPRKITREWVNAVLRSFDASSDDAFLLRQIADALASYLPPIPGTP